MSFWDAISLVWLVASLIALVFGFKSGRADWVGGGLLALVLWLLLYRDRIGEFWKSLTTVSGAS